jgi:hypothetical protein
MIARREQPAPLIDMMNARELVLSHEADTDRSANIFRKPLRLSR